jgi:hypothetical protein
MGDSDGQTSETPSLVNAFGRGIAYQEPASVPDSCAEPMDLDSVALSSPAHLFLDRDRLVYVHKLVTQYGEFALEIAAIRAVELLAQGGMPRLRVWIEILARIRRLDTTTQTETQH